MPSAVRLREDYSAEELRVLARRSKTVNQSRRLLSLAAVRDGMDRGRRRRSRMHVFTFGKSKHPMLSNSALDRMREALAAENEAEQMSAE